MNLERTRGERGRALDPYVREEPTTPRDDRHRTNRQSSPDRPARQAEAWPRPRTTATRSSEHNAVRSVPPPLPARATQGQIKTPAMHIKTPKPQLHAPGLGLAQPRRLSMPAPPMMGPPMMGPPLALSMPRPPLPPPTILPTPMAAPQPQPQPTPPRGVRTIETPAPRPRPSKERPIWPIVFIAILGGLAWWRYEQSNDPAAKLRAAATVQSAPIASAALPPSASVAAPSMLAPSASPTQSAVQTPTPREMPAAQIDSPMLGVVPRPPAPPGATSEMGAPVADSAIPGVPPSSIGARVTPDPSRLGGVRVTLPFKMPARPASSATPVPSSSGSASPPVQPRARPTAARSHLSPSGPRRAFAMPEEKSDVSEPAAALDEASAKLQALMRRAP